MQTYYIMHDSLAHLTIADTQLDAPSQKYNFRIEF